MRAPVLVLLLAGIPRTADACSCAPEVPACEAYWRAAAIFRGRVEAIGKSPESATSWPRLLRVRFAVLERFTGVDSETVVVATATGGGTCGYRFAVGREYVVYAHNSRDGLTTGICTRTRPVDRADGDLEFARNIAAGGRPLGRISGIVLREVQDPSTGRDGRQPMADVEVTLQRGELSFSARTDSGGWFEVAGLEAGTYTPTLHLPEGFRQRATNPPSIELLDARGCATMNALVAPDGRVTGRVVDGRGRPVRGITVDLLASGRGPEAYPGPAPLRGTTRLDGTFEIGGIPPGRFRMAIDHRRSSESSGPRVFFPGVLTSSSAAVVTVPLGGRVATRDFVLPQATPFVEIAGIVVDSDRAPLEGARVYLRGPAERDVIIGLPVATDWSGRFVVSALAGEEYLLFAERPRPGGGAGRLDTSEPVRVTPHPDASPLTITLRSRY